MNKDILAKINKLETLRLKLKLEIDALKKTIYIECKYCGVLEQIGNITYIQTHWYEPPYSCSGGDYWNEGEGNWKCESCNKINRLIDSHDGMYVNLKYHFKERVDTYDNR